MKSVLAPPAAPTPPSRAPGPRAAPPGTVSPIARPQREPGAPASRVVLAASGAVLLAFVVLHAGGNLLAFAGRDAFNAYARSLRELGTPLVAPGVALALFRVTLAGTLAAHLAAHLRVLQLGAQSCLPGVSPPGYAAYPLPLFRLSGVAILLFVVFHVAQLTFGWTHPAFDPKDPYGNTVAALRAWPVALAYIGVAAAVGAHVLPGVWTGARSLGLLRPGTAGLVRAVAPVAATAVAVGLAAVPVSVVSGLMR